ncbi:hypothetical protein EBI_26826, partial [Enterocytozoon bieneusi H348]
MKRTMKKLKREIKINKFFILIFKTLASELLFINPGAKPLKVANGPHPLTFLN